MKIDIFNDGISYVTDEVSTIPTQCANLSKETREKFVTDLAAVSRGKSGSNNPKVRFQSLLKEAAPNEFLEEGVDIEKVSSRPLEFLPVIVTFVKEEHNDKIYYYLENGNSDGIVEEDFYNNILRFSYVTSSNDYSIELYTNFRTLYNAGLSEEQIPFVETVRYRVSKDGEKKVISTNEVLLDIEETSGIELEDSIEFYVSDLLENGYTIDNIIEDVKAGYCFVPYYEKFKAIKLALPMAYWSQWPMTHTQLSKESQSDRVAENVNYWLPSDIIEKFNNYIIDTDGELSGEACEQLESIQFITKAPDLSKEAKLQAIKDIMLHVLPQNRFQEILKEIGYKREIWSRAPYYFKYKEVVVTGWYNDPTTWQHSFLERNGYDEYYKNWTQKESQQIIKAVMEVVNS